MFAKCLCLRHSFASTRNILRLTPPAVIPAQAGTQSDKSYTLGLWAPACAGGGVAGV
jgi:hypothetical protein